MAKTPRIGAGGLPQMGVTKPLACDPDEDCCEQIQTCADFAAWIATLTGASMTVSATPNAALWAANCPLETPDCSTIDGEILLDAASGDWTGAPPGDTCGGLFGYEAGIVCGGLRTYGYSLGVVCAGDPPTVTITAWHRAAVVSPPGPGCLNLAERNIALPTTIAAISSGTLTNLGNMVGGLCEVTADIPYELF